MPVVFFEGQTPVQEGLYIRLADTTELLDSGVTTDEVVALITAERGPLGTVVKASQLGTIATRFGSGAGPDVAKQVLYGGAPSVKILRVGTGGTAASRTFVDTTGTPVNVFVVTAVDKGTDGNDLSFTIEDLPDDPTNFRHMLIFRGTTQIEEHIFAKGSSGTGEPALLAAKINADSTVVTTGAVTNGNKIMEAVSGVSLSGGASVTTDAAAWTAALTLLTGVSFNIFTADTEDATNWAAISAQINTWHADGKFVEAVLGVSSSEEAAEEDRVARVTALANYHIKGVINGFTQEGTNYTATALAGRVAGMMASKPVTFSQTSRRIVGATAVVDPGEDFDNIVSGGAIAARLSSSGNVVLSRDVTSLTSPTAPLDSGWKYGRNVRQRLNFFARLLALKEQLIGGGIGNDDVGRGLAASAFTNLIEDEIREGAFISGEAREDADNPPSGTTAFFVINFQDIGSLDQVLVTIGIDF